MKTIASILISLCLATGCICRYNTSSLSFRPRMSKSEIRDLLGPPEAIRGPIKNKYDQHIDIWEYRLTELKKYKCTIVSTSTCYWLYFYNNRLVLWDEKENLLEEAVERINQLGYLNGELVIAKERGIGHVIPK
jgi:hypothetical protein